MITEKLQQQTGENRHGEREVFDYSKFTIDNRKWRLKPDIS